MPTARQLLGLGSRGAKALGGWTAPQESVGLLNLLKEAMLQRNPGSKPLNLRLGPDGEVLYDSSSIDSPAAAMGSFVQTMPEAGDSDVLAHELRHVKQSDTLGPGYLAGAIREQGYDYGAGPMERDAIAEATPQSEILRPGSSMYEEPENTQLLQMLQKWLGQSKVK